MTSTWDANPSPVRQVPEVTPPTIGGPDLGVPQPPAAPQPAPAPPDHWVPVDPNAAPGYYVGQAPATPTSPDQWVHVDPNPAAGYYSGQPAVAPAGWNPGTTGIQPESSPVAPTIPGQWSPVDANGYPRADWSEPSGSHGPPDPNGAVPTAANPSPSPPDQWVYVDPSAFSDPFTEQPVYSSGPQPTASVQAAPPAPAPSPYPANEHVPGQSVTNVTGYIQPGMPPQYGQTPGMGIPQQVIPPVHGQVPTPAYQATPGPHNAPPASDPLAQVQQTDPTLAPNYQPEKGDLKIKERRTWKTWQLAAAVVLAAIVGMWFNGNAGTASGSSSATGSGSSSYKLPPPGASGTTATTGGATPPASKAAGSSSTSTTVSSSATSTTVAGASTTPTSAVAVGPATILVPQTTQSGNWTSPAFTIAGGTWNIGWAYQCTPAPSGGPSFQIFVVNAGASPGSSPAVTSTGASGQAVSPETTTGSQQVIIQTTAACRWALKVTGSSS